MVEDVWKDAPNHPKVEVIRKQQQQTEDYYQHPCQQQRQGHHYYSQERQSTLGEMTLGDLLVRTGVVRDDPDAGSYTAESNNLYSPISGGTVTSNLPSPMEALTTGFQHDWIHASQHPHQHQQIMRHAEAVAASRRGFQPPALLIPGENPMYDGIADDGMLGTDSLGSSIAPSPSFSDYSTHSRKRFPSDIAVDKTMERRQKRMIKNRESAARSRARKQAYTVELEAEVNMLKEENARLKQQQALQRHLPKVLAVHNTQIRGLRRVHSF
ncbi:hypothetical protein KP509_21G054800 [Ceratopteris richardii]|nr:hypothetical protein KP509_21G054800 [Ceratopteris richardii]